MPRTRRWFHCPITVTAGSFFIPGDFAPARCRPTCRDFRRSPAPISIPRSPIASRALRSITITPAPAGISTGRTANTPTGPTARTARSRSPRGSQTDSLGRGTLRTLWRTDLRFDAVRALRAEGTPISAELVSLAGAEPLDAGWHGWWQDTVHVGGKYSWGIAGTDTLTSPAV